MRQWRIRRRGRMHEAGIDQLTEWRTFYAAGAFRREQRRRAALFALTATVLGVAAVTALWGLPLLLTRHPSSGMTGIQRLGAANDVRSVLAAFFIAVGAAGSLLFTGRTYLLSRDGQLADRYAKAVDQVASDKLGVRIGGVYGLETLARQSPPYQVAIVEVLCAFLREHAGPPPGPVYTAAADVQAAATVIGRLPRHWSPAILDFTGAHLENVDFTGAQLGQSVFRGTYLAGAYFGRALLHGSYFRDAHGTDSAHFSFEVNGITSLDVGRTS